MANRTGKKGVDPNSLISSEKIISTLETVNSKKERKIKFQILLKKLETNVVLKENQKEYSVKIRNNQIVFAQGPAGASKTYTACYTLLKLLFEGKIQKIIFTKPIRESGENLGFLPGSVDEKMAPYVESFIYTCKEMLGDINIDFLIEKKYIECRPLAYMRGITFNDCGLFLDECQNVTYDQLILYITRLGERSKMVIAGDITQRDIEKKKVAMNEFSEMLKTIDGITVHEFKKEDIVRNKILIEITDKYEQWKELKGL